MRQEIDYGQFRYEAFSLMWRDVKRKEFFKLSIEDMDDLNLLVFKKLIQEKREIDISEWLSEMPINKEDSLYRQEVMSDFVGSNVLFETLFKYGEEAHKLMAMGKFAFEKEATVYNVIKRLDEVENIRLMVEQVIGVLNQADIKSEGLNRYKRLIREIIDSPIYEAFIGDVKIIKSLDGGVKSIKIGLNLDEYLQPVEAILLELSNEEFKYSRFMKKMGYYVNAGVNEIKMIPRKLFARETVKPPEALNTLEKTIEPATLQLIKFCDQFNMKILEVLSVLYHELPYYQIGLDLVEKLKANNEPVCIPKWEDEIFLENIYHINLGIDQKEEVVKNTLRFTKEKPIVILTGANRGGKTTITQTISIALWFGQLGFYLPGTTNLLPYVHELLIHFPKEERETIHLGRLGEECKRFKDLYSISSPNSFYLMNEAFQGTSHGESLQIALETLKAIYVKGGMVLFNTHLHELVEELEKEIPPSHIISLIAGKDMKKSPYVIEEGRPLGKSYAYEIAKRYGMLYEQLVEEN
jgi:DNA mismatch repair ATPase MutS